MAVNRRRSSSVVSNIALNVPVLHIDDNSVFKRSWAHSRSKSFSSSLDNASDSVTNDLLVLDPLNNKESSSVWDSVLHPYKAFVDIPFEDYVLLNEDGTEDEFKTQLEFIKEENSRFLNDLDGIMVHLDRFLEINEEVTNQTSQFKVKSNDMVKDLDELQHTYDGLTERLEIFESLDTIVTKLSKSNTTKSIVRPSFRDDILTKLDEAIIFVNDERHKDYKEIDVFKYRFEQCLIRALSLIRNYLVKTIRNIEADTVGAIKDLKDKSSAVLISSIVNNKFSESISILYSPFVELYQRSFDNDDVANLLEDVYNQYQKSRSSLVKTYITDPHFDTIKTTGSLSKLTQLSLSFFSTTLDKELEIFEKAFFLPPNEHGVLVTNSTNMVQMHKYFEVLLDPIYYSLRHKIIRESQIDVLCELINVIQSYFNKNDEFDINNVQLVRVDYELLFQPILEDVQTRLVFRVQIFLEANIVNYKKTGRELIIENRREAEKEEQAEVSVSLANMDFVTPSKIVYPPMVDAVKLLTKIYTLVKQAVFDILTASVVHLCILSLKSNFGQTTKDSSIKLYEMESLLWFKDSINMFDIEHVRKDVNLDFSGLRNLFGRFTGYGNYSAQLNSTTHASLFDTIWGTIPTVVADYTDCRVELQIELRNVVQEFIELSSEPFVCELREVTMKIQNGETIDNSQVDSAISTLKSCIQDELPRLKVRVDEFISEDRIFEFLLDGVQNVLMKEYKALYEAVTALSESNETYRSLIAEVLEVDEVSKLWADSVKMLFMASTQEQDADLALTEDEGSTV